MDNELAAWKIIKDATRKVLDSYPQSLEEDKRIMEDDEKCPFLTVNQRNCVLYRMGEKEILNFLVESSDEMAVLLGVDQTEETFKKIVKNSDVEPYVKRVYQIASF